MPIILIIYENNFYLYGCQINFLKIIFYKKFGDLEFNCNEFSLYDVEKLKIFE